MRREMTQWEYLHWMAYYDQESHVMDAKSRHPQWSAEKCWAYVREAYDIHLRSKQLQGKGG